MGRWLMHMKMWRVKADMSAAAGIERAGEG